MSYEVSPMPKTFDGVYHADKLFAEQCRERDWWTICTSKDPHKALEEHYTRVKASVADALLSPLPGDESSNEDASGAMVEKPVKNTWQRKNNNIKKVETIASKKRLVDFDTLQEESGLTRKQYAALMRQWLKDNK